MQEGSKVPQDTPTAPIFPTLAEEEEERLSRTSSTDDLPEVMRVSNDHPALSEAAREETTSQYLAQLSRSLGVVPSAEEVITALEEVERIANPLRVLEATEFIN